MTRMSDDELKEVTEASLSSLAVDLGLDFGGSFMRTGGENKHSKNQEVEVHRNVNDTMNYANVIGSV